MYLKEVNRVIGAASKNGGMVPLSQDLINEIDHWSFLDSFSGCFTWHKEKHLQISLATYSSLYKWGAIVFSDNDIARMGDLWDSNDRRPIHLKEGDALVKALYSVSEVVRDHRVDAFLDSSSCVYAWENQKAKDPELNKLMKALYSLTEFNVDLKLLYIPSAENPADSISRKLSAQDCMLDRDKFLVLEHTSGLLDIDLMALDSNVMRNRKSEPLRHFTPYPTPLSDGVNVFLKFWIRIWCTLLFLHLVSSCLFCHF